MNENKVVVTQGNSTIIDRRIDGKNKSLPNRQKFLNRTKGALRKAVMDSFKGKSIADIDSGEKIHIPKRGIEEPIFRHGRGGRQENIHPGNKEFTAGDRIARPPKGGRGGSGRGNASNSGEGEDDFEFALSREEYLKLLFEDLALPDFIVKQLIQIKDWKTSRAGFTSVGSPCSLAIVPTFRKAYARRIAILGARKKELEDLEAELEDLVKNGASLEDERVIVLIERIREIRSKKKPIFIEPLNDLRFKFLTKVPVFTSAAVMFCIMDVSGSMGEKHKELAKRFFTLLYLFLKRNYEKIEVVFIRHHTTAKEVDEKEFFYGKETGGTQVSSALALWQEIVKKRYPVNAWNIYAAQASDGDNWFNDSSVCVEILSQMLPLTQYFTYIEVLPDRHQNLWDAYESVRDAGHRNLAMRQVDGPEDIYPVFKDLFKKGGK